MRARLYEPSRAAAPRGAARLPGCHPRRHRRAAPGRAGPAAVAAAASRSSRRTFPELLALRDRAGDHRRRSSRPALWLSSDAALAPDGKVGLMGISFSGGLSVVAAGRPSLADRVAYVLSVGGHARSAAGAAVSVHRRRAATGQPDPAEGEHDRTGSRARSCGRRTTTASRVMLLGVADRVVPAAQVEPLRAAVRRFLVASPPRARGQSAGGWRVRGAARRGEAAAEPSATLLRYVNERDVVHLGARLLPSRRRLRRRSGAVAVAVAEADRRRCFCCTADGRQRHPGGRVRVSGRRASRPRAGAAAAERLRPRRRGPIEPMRYGRRAAAGRVLGDLLSR